MGPRARRLQRGHPSRSEFAQPIRQPRPTSGRTRATTIARWRITTRRSASIRDMPAPMMHARRSGEIRRQLDRALTEIREALRLAAEEPRLRDVACRQYLSRDGRYRSRASRLYGEALALDPTLATSLWRPRFHLIRRSANMIAPWPITIEAIRLNPQCPQDTLRPAATVAPERRSGPRAERYRPVAQAQSRTT